MRYACKLFIGALVLLGVYGVAAVGPVPASAGSVECTVRQAQRDVAAAKRAVATAEARLSEARYVLSATKTATASYGSSVGRWVRLSRQSGWSRATIQQLTYVIYRESRGMPNAVNSSSGAAGLLQFMPQWYTGEWDMKPFDPFDPKKNLQMGWWLYKRQGWTPWAL